MKDKLAAVEQYFVHYNRGEFAKAREYWAPEGTWVVKGKSPLSKTYSIDELLSGVERLGQRIMPEGANIVVSPWLEMGNRLVVEATSQGKVANGKIYENQYCFLLEFNDQGLLVKGTEYLCSFHQMETLGEYIG